MGAAACIVVDLNKDGRPDVACIDSTRLKWYEYNPPTNRELPAPARPENLTMRNVVIIGSGCAGNTAAIYAARANLKPLVVAGHEAGGATLAHSPGGEFPGLPHRHQRPRTGREHEAAGGTISAPSMSTARSSKPISRSVPSASTSRAIGSKTRTVIVASGASARWLGLKASRNSSAAASAVALPATASSIAAKRSR